MFFSKSLLTSFVQGPLDTSGALARRLHNTEVRVVSIYFKSWLWSTEGKTDDWIAKLGSVKHVQAKIAYKLKLSTKVIIIERDVCLEG